MSKLNKELCVSCSKYQVLSGGDFVPYGSTIAQLPEVWGCIDDWDTSDEGEVVAVTDCEHYKKKGGFNGIE